MGWVPLGEIRNTMLTVLDLARADNTGFMSESRTSFCGPCPNPDCSKRHDGFVVKWDNERERWSFMCRGCWDAQEILSALDAKKIGKPDRAGEKRGFGDAIDYLRHMRKMTYPEARAYLDEQSGDSSEQNRPRQRPGYKKEQYNYESARWQEDTKLAVQAYEERLWTPEGTAALDYARGRGLLDTTIKGAHFGFSDKGGIPRLIIPVYSNGRYTAVYRRDLRPDVPKPDRWRDAPGSTKHELYLADCLKAKRPTVVVESAICALSIVQTCSNMVNVVATGSTMGVRDNVMALTTLARMPLVLLAFDADPDGDKCAAWWKQRLPNAYRLRPILHDVNDMLVDQWDIRAWVGQAVAKCEREQLAQEEPVPPQHHHFDESPSIATTPNDSEPAEDTDDEPLECAMCGVKAQQVPERNFFYDAEGHPFCSDACQRCYQIRQHPVVSEAIRLFRPTSMQVFPPEMSLSEIRQHVQREDEQRQRDELAQRIERTQARLAARRPPMVKPVSDETVRG